MAADYLSSLRKIMEASTDDFAKLLKISQLDPTQDFQYSDLSGVDFGNFDFSTLNLTGALTDGVKYRSTELNPSTPSVVAEDSSLPPVPLRDLEPNVPLLFTNLIFRIISNVRRRYASAFSPSISSRTVTFAVDDEIFANAPELISESFRRNADNHTSTISAYYLWRFICKGQRWRVFVKEPSRFDWLQYTLH